MIINIDKEKAFAAMFDGYAAIFGRELLKTYNEVKAKSKPSGNKS